MSETTEFLAELNQAWAILIVGVLTAVASVWAYILQSKATRKAQERLLFAQAFAAVTSWKELPYRVARRTDDSPESHKALIDEFHRLQLELEQHLAWVQVADHEIGRKFDRLVKETKRQCSPHFEAAWAQEPQGSAPLGEKYSIDVNGLKSNYLRAVRKRLRIRPGLLQ